MPAKIVRFVNVVHCYLKFGPREARWYLAQCKAYRERKGIR